MAATVRIISRRTVCASPRPRQSPASSSSEVIHLTPWDLLMLSVNYIQKGILLPQPPLEKYDFLISSLLSSFTLALNHFFPLAGRLTTVHHDTTPPSLTVSLLCNDAGAEFVHASAPDITCSDILNSNIIPSSLINSMFPLNGLIGHDGHDAPLLGVQLTELKDAIFIACSLNHAVGDGTSFWCFFNCWSEISRNNDSTVSLSPILDRWFLDSCPPPIHLPLADATEFIKRPVYTPVKECFFCFSGDSLVELKAKANQEMHATRISTLQALLAHVWRMVSKARRLKPEEETTYMVLVGNRKRVTPPLPEEYLGNTVFSAAATAKAGDIMEKGLGWAAWQLNQAVASMTEETVRGLLASWTQKPVFAYTSSLRKGDLATGSSPRFNIYGNDFGWGKPVAVRSGPGNKVDGKVTVYPGLEAGSMALEVCVSPVAARALLEDEEFMDAVNT